MNRILAATLAYDIVLVLTGLFVIRYGGRYERLALLLCVVAGVCTALLPRLQPMAGDSIRYAYLVVDAAALIAFDAIMMRSRRYWPVWATGIQLATVLLGIAVALSPEALQQYRLIQGKFAYLIFLSLVLGSIRRRTRPPADAPERDEPQH